ncbi:MAG: undecaprenyl/decaprenyl-phosphate alpha-N-acetylglucosaminyl 1-phosphate transferase [Phycisphaerales bacterium]|nr:undecaprenyl/decaprenyl-phosphate alpha-N-acetylglucosaminyl 1-phosphate transferase [Phycisphaerales bacterium]
MIPHYFVPILAQTPTATDVLSPYVYVFYASFLVAFIFTPIMRSVASFFNIIDAPDGKRKMHNAPIAYLGGVAVFLGLLAGLTVSQFVTLHRIEPGWPSHLIIKFSIVVGACVIVLLGLWDDIKKVSPAVKIAGQVLAALMLLVDGVGTELARASLTYIHSGLVLKLGMEPLSSSVFNTLSLSISSVIVVAVVVFCCNATNLMDGLDGLCGGVTAIIAAGFLFLAVNLAMWGGALGINWDGLRVVLALSLLGALLGFLPYNFNPASIFMGDTGSMLLGYVCAVMLILLGQQQHPKWFLAGMVIFALPVLDTALAFARRWFNHRPLFSPDKFHIHHQFISRGFSVKQTVVLMYAMAIGFVLLGSLIVYLRTRFAIAVWMVTFCCLMVAAYKMGLVQERKVVVSRRLGEQTAEQPPVTPSMDESTIAQPDSGGGVVVIDNSPAAASISSTTLSHS